MTSLRKYLPWYLSGWPRKTSDWPDVYPLSQTAELNASTFKYHQDILTLE
jgi:hypothetical protein